MNCREFVRATVCNFEAQSLELLKEILIDEFLDFHVIKRGAVDSSVLAEKICDYSETLSIKAGRTFEKQLECFLNDIDSITSSKIAKPQQPAKGSNTPAAIPRSRKYYEKAIELKGKKDLTIRQLIDYTRIMLCLYAASMKNGDNPVENFDFSFECIDPNRLIEHVKQEEVQVVFPPSKRKRFNIKEKYSTDSWFLVILAVILCTIYNERMLG